MESLKEKIIRKIQNKEISKKPRWFFIIKNSVFWIFWAASIVVGSASFAVIVFLVYDYDWDIYSKLNTSLPEHIIMSLPYVWIVMLGACVWFAYREFKKTKTGYRFAPYVIAGGSIIASILIGSGVYISGFGEKIDAVIFDTVPSYREIMRTKMDIWKNPDHGLIAGRLGIKIEDMLFEFTDLEKKVWRVDITRAVWRAPVPLMPGMTVRVIGEPAEFGIFRASEIRPWRKMYPMDGMKEPFPVPRSR